METNKINVGDTYTLNFSYSQEQVDAFAICTGDNNPIHLDKEYAAITVFKKPIMHGFLGGAVFSKIFGTLFPGNGTIYLKQSLIFLKPMFVKEEYTAVVGVIDINRDKHRATIMTKIINRNKEDVISGEAVISNIEKI